MNAHVRTTFLFPATLAAVAATIPGAAQATSTTCSTSTVCAEYINTYAYSSGATTGGVAIHGEANSGIGIRGTSVANVGFYGASGSGVVTAPGVEGESSQPGAGVGGGFGLVGGYAPYLPEIGVIAYGTDHGAFGEVVSPGTSSSSAGYGIYGDDYGFPPQGGDVNAGIFGESPYVTAILAEASQTGPTQGIYGQASVGVYSVANTISGTPSNTAYAFVGESNSYGLDLYNSSNEAQTAASTPTDFLTGSASGGSFHIDYNGNEAISGRLMTSKSTYVRTTGRSGSSIREYTARGTTPDVEDLGEAHLSNGRAFVPIDARFADTIDRRASYLVFVTPEGDGDGLFVAQKTPAGFVVREMHGGRSSLAFQYRIVAKPLGEDGARLAAIPADSFSKDSPFDRARTPVRLDRPLTPIERMKKELGPVRYASAIKALRARLAVTR